MAESCLTAPLPSTRERRPSALGLGLSSTQPAWTVSYTQESRLQELVQSREPSDIDKYNYGNNKSADFFRKMQASFAETERLRQTCRMARSSVVRSQEDKANLDHFGKGIEVPLAIFGRDTLQLDDGALAGVAQIAALKAATAVAEQATAVREVLLPGALEPFEETVGTRQACHTDVPLGTLQATSPQTAPPLHPRSESESKIGAEDRPLSSPGFDSSAEEELDRFGESPDLDAEENRGAGASQGDSANQEDGSDLTSGDEEEDEDEDDDEDDGSAATDDKWPPRPPLLRFKMLSQFSVRFKPPELKAALDSVNADLRMKETQKEVKDVNVTWANKTFEMMLQTESQFEVGFPIVLITMLDAIYPKRVRWREVDWRIQYKRSLQKNYSVLQKIWAEVNMDKAKEFRVENTPLRLENMLVSTLKEKLEFLRLMKRWFDQRIHHSGPYDPVERRREFAEQCRLAGHTVKFPPWVRFEKEAKPDPRRSVVSVYSRMPEYKRLIWFLGSPEHQTM